MDQIPEIDLSKKARQFVSLILAGKTTVEAHKLAGYTGDPHAAYEMRSKLRGFIRSEADRRGISLEGVAVNLAALDALPLNATQVTVKEKLAIIRETRELLAQEAPPPKANDFKRFTVVEAEVIPDARGNSALPAPPPASSSPQMPE
jgi:hypothetical protein